MLELMFSGPSVIATVALVIVTSFIFILERKYITRNCSRCDRVNFIPKRKPFFECNYCGEDLDKLAKLKLQEKKVKNNLLSQELLR